jgi:hypothetical protein
MLRENDMPEAVRARWPRPCPALPLAVLIGFHSCVQAAEGDSDTAIFHLDGFGTFGLVHSSRHDADFVADPLQTSGAGASGAWTGKVDTRLGVQLSATFTPALSAVVQVISDQTPDGDFRPHVEWANVRYQFRPTFGVRLGRTVLTSFLVSDYRKVGYINPWVRPPVELYNLVPTTNSDGIDIIYERPIGSAMHSLRLHAGQSDVRLPDAGGPRGLRVRNGWGISDQVEHGAWTLHGSYRQADLTLESFNALFAGFRQFGAPGEAIARRYDADGSQLWFAGAGAVYDPGDWFAQGEWGTLNTHSAIGDRTAWYVSAGLRRGRFTPFATYANSAADMETSDPGLDAAAFPIAAQESITALNAALNQALGSIPVQRTVSLGLRWDVWTHVALKLQFDHIRLGDGSRGTLVNQQPGAELGGHANILSVSADVVF